MYFWKIKNLKQDIKENKITPKESRLYLILFSLLYLFLLIQAIVQIELLWNMEMVVLQISIVLLGLLYIYKKSNKAFFFNHLSAIGWVFLLRSLFFMTIGMLNLYVMTYLFGVEEFFSAKNSVIIGMSFEVLLYWRIGKHIEIFK